MKHFKKYMMAIGRMSYKVRKCAVFFPIVIFLAMAVSMSSCRKMIDVRLPVDQLVTNSVFTDSATAQAAVNGIYSQMVNNGESGGIFTARMTILPGESADELLDIQNSFDQFYTNSLLPTQGDISDFWAQNYNIIYIANSVITGAQTSTTLSVSLKNHLIGEAKFIRAFCQFYLVNYFGKVPLIISTDINLTNHQAASSIDEVYTQIISDLNDARDKLSSDYSWSGGDRTRVNSFAASALLARVYLYKGEYALSQAEASRVINASSQYALVSDPNNVFLANSKEAILQFYNSSSGFTYLAQAVLPAGGGVPTYTVNPLLLKAFESGDIRSQKWIKSVSISGTSYTVPFKYKSRSNKNLEYYMVLRLAEQYLIRAEAEAQQGDLNNAKSDLNAIRKRAGLPNTTASDKPLLLAAIEHERQVELFTEWGDRWLDLKRTNRADAILGAEKPSAWKPTAVLYPIPYSAISTNSTLVQNPGY